MSLEVMPDHVHLLVECDPQFGIHRLVRFIKGRSSRTLRQEFPVLKRKLLCGIVLDRDHNAAINILALGRSVQAVQAS